MGPLYMLITSFIVFTRTADNVAYGRCFLKYKLKEPFTSSKTIDGIFLFVCFVLFLTSSNNLGFQAKGILNLVLPA